MTGLVERLRAWLGSLTSSTDGDGSQDSDTAGGSQTADGSQSVDAGTASRTEAAPDDEPAFACRVCGTPVENPEEGCPLCRSTDVVSRDPGLSDVDHERADRTDEGGDRTDSEDGAVTDAGDTAPTAAADTEDTASTTTEDTASTTTEDTASTTTEDTASTDAEETPAESLSASKATEVRTGDVDDDAVSRLRALREGEEPTDDAESES